MTRPRPDSVTMVTSAVEEAVAKGESMADEAVTMVVSTGDEAVARGGAHGGRGCGLWL